MSVGKQNVGSGAQLQCTIQVYSVRSCNGRVDKTTDIHTGGPLFESSPAVVPLGKAPYSYCRVPWKGLKAIGSPVGCLYAARFCSAQWPGKINSTTATLLHKKKS